MAEQFGFGEALGQRAAVNGQKRLLATGAVMMEIAGHHLLAGAGFAHDQHGRLRWREFVQQALEGLRRRVDQRGSGGRGFWVQHSGPPIVDALNLSCGGRRNQRGKARGCCKCASGCAAAARFATAWRGEAVFSALILKD